jgi:hypothetical protein
VVVKTRLVKNAGCDRMEGLASRAERGKKGRWGVPYLKLRLRRHSASRGFKMSAADALLNLEMSAGVWARGGMQ